MTIPLTSFVVFWLISSIVEKLRPDEPMETNFAPFPTASVKVSDAMLRMLKIVPGTSMVMFTREGAQYPSIDTGAFVADRTVTDFHRGINWSLKVC